MAELTDKLADSIIERVKKSKGKTTLRIKIVDFENNVAVQMYSKSYKVSIRDMIDFCKENGLEDKFSIK